ncbi:MAG: hypothetical protein ACWGQW_20360, partial [bacterium]
MPTPKPILERSLYEEETETLPEYKFPQVVDSSMRGDFVSCPMQFYYRSLEHLSSLRPSIHLHAGATFARGLEVFRRKYYGEKQKIEVAFADAIAAMFIEWGDYEPCFSWEDDSESKYLDRLILALGEYLTEYNPASDHIQPF